MAAMNIRQVSSIAVVALAFTACSSDAEVTLDDPTVAETEAPAEESADNDATSSEVDSGDEADADPTTTVEDVAVESEGDPESTSEDNEVVETTPPTTSTVAATGEEMADELELITILGIRAGAGSGEYEVVVSGRPEGFERFKLSLSGADRYCTPEQFNNQGSDVGDGTVSIGWFSDTCGGSTVGVAWVHTDGRRSGISYHTCEGGVSLTGELC